MQNMNNEEPKTIAKYGDDAVQAVMKGIRDVANATITTLGPRGLNFLIEENWGEPTVLHDGVRVSTAFRPEDPYERQGAKLIQEVGKKMRDSVGDGTTVGTLLALSLTEEALRVKAAKNNVMTLREGLESGAKKVVAKLQDISTPVTTLKQKIQIATISAEDEDLGTMIAETIHKTGADGVVTVDTSKASETFVEMQEGMQIDKGYTHAFMMTDPEKQKAILDDCYVLVTDKPLNSMQEIGKYLETVIAPNTKKVLFISPEVGVDFMQPLLQAKIAGSFLGVAMRAPGVGPMQLEMLEDICALTGATLISKDAGHKFDDFDFTALGHAHRIIMSKLSTIIEGGAGKKVDILNRVQVIRTRMEETDISDFDREQLKGRLAKLTSGVAVIKVGGHTEAEVKERKERAEDAVASTIAASRYGLVPGGEISYLLAREVLDQNNLGEKILYDAMKEPFKLLVEHAGYDAGQLLERLKGTVMADYTKYKLGKEAFGFDVIDGEMKDMIKAGIVDALAVPQTAIQTAVSFATMVSSMGGAVVFKNRKEEK